MRLGPKSLKRAGSPAALRDAVSVVAGVSYDIDAAAIFAAFSIAPTLARRAVINAYVVGLKADGIWPLLDILYLMAAADSQAGTINWKSPGAFGLIGVNSPSFTADRGYTGNGTSSRLRTQYTPSINGVNYVQDNASAWLYLLTNPSSGSPDLGSTTAPRAVITGNNAGNGSADINNAAGQSISFANTAPGLIGIQRRGSTDRRVFLNGAQVATSAVASTGPASQEQWVCGANATAFSTRQQAVAAWGASLSGREAAFYSRTLAYLQAIGAA
jgi:hypothetical protein